MLCKHEVTGSIPVSSTKFLHPAAGLCYLTSTQQNRGCPKLSGKRELDAEPWAEVLSEAPQGALLESSKVDV